MRQVLDRRLKLHRKLSPTLLKNTLSEARTAMLFPVLLGLSLRAELCTGQDHVYPTQKWGGYTVFLQPKDQQKFTLLINNIWSNQKPMTKAQQHEVSKPHSGHTFIPWSLAICLLSNQPRRINKNLNTSTLAMV